MTVNFWKAAGTAGSTRERRQKLIDYAIVWLMIALTAAGVVPHLTASWKALISAS
jgi:hypothetical protein